MSLLTRAAALPVYRALWNGRAPRAIEEAPFLTSWGGAA